MSSTDPSPVELPARPMVDGNGQIFELPDFTMKQIHDAIPAHCFKPSTLRSLAYVVRDILYVSVLVYGATYISRLPYPALRFLAWAAYSVLQGFVFTGIWILAHECGHGAFSKSKKLNWTVGLVLHSFLLVPFHSWRLTHSAHHKATGNLEKDTAFVPHTKESWVKSRAGEDAETDRVELSHLAEDAPLVVLGKCIIHQLLGWPGYLLFNWTGQTSDKTFPQKSHFYFGEDSLFWKKDQLSLILLSDVGVLAMVACLVIGGQIIGSANMMLLYLVPWLWVNHWIVAITFLQHTDLSLPHYSNKVWTFARGATATIDRDLGFIDTHLFHDIIGTHVCHHLISTIPFYHAGEASVHIRRVMGRHYRSDTTTPFMTAFWQNQKRCNFVEETESGSGVYVYKTVATKQGAGESGPTEAGATSGAHAGSEDTVSQLRMETKETRAVMATGRSGDVKRRFSGAGHLTATLPLLSE